MDCLLPRTPVRRGRDLFGVEPRSRACIWLRLCCIVVICFACNSGQASATVDDKNPGGTFDVAETRDGNDGKPLEIGGPLSRTEQGDGYRLEAQSEGGTKSGGQGNEVSGSNDRQDRQGTAGTTPSSDGQQGPSPMDSDSAKKLDEEELDAFEAEMLERMYTAELKALGRRTWIDNFFVDRGGPRMEYPMHVRPSLSGFLMTSPLVVSVISLVSTLRMTRNLWGLMFALLWLAASYGLSTKYALHRGKGLDKLGVQLQHREWEQLTPKEKRQLQMEFFRNVLSTNRPRLQGSSYIAGLALLFLAAFAPTTRRMRIPNNTGFNTVAFLEERTLTILAIILMVVGAVRYMRSVSARRRYDYETRKMFRARSDKVKAKKRPSVTEADADGASATEANQDGEREVLEYRGAL
ncbi:putative transmembrane protein [Toxoplasma gondii MAS]|uniref:Putative transmembrane protein n=1 Tax=Toxoplasma gondii MAS TaxID=943118 RepID=A0A086PL54_TOXGO|nr:putative transmembrane protein [Toxoplasma gondii MAS]